MKKTKNAQGWRRRGTTELSYIEGIGVDIGTTSFGNHFGNIYEDWASAYLMTSKTTSRSILKRNGHQMSCVRMFTATLFVTVIS